MGAQRRGQGSDQASINWALKDLSPNPLRSPSPHVSIVPRNIWNAFPLWCSIPRDICSRPMDHDGDATSSSIFVHYAGQFGAMCQATGGQKAYTSR